MSISFCLLLHSEDKALLIQILSKYHFCAQHLCILWGGKATRKALQNMYLPVRTPRTGILENPNLKSNVLVQEKVFIFLLISLVSLNHCLLMFTAWIVLWGAQPCRPQWILGQLSKNSLHVMSMLQHGKDVEFQAIKFSHKKMGQVLQDLFLYQKLQDSLQQNIST